MALFFAGLAYLAGNLYLSFWLLRWLAAWGWPLTAPAAGAAVLTVFWLWAASPVWAFLARKGPLRRPLRRACGMWLAFMLYGFLLAGAFAGLRHLALRWPGYTALPVAARARVLAAAGSLALAIDLALCVGGRRRAERLRVRRRAVSVAKACETPRLRVALVADLHLGSNLGLAGLRRLCAAIRAEKPDLVCIAGDLFDNCFDDIEQPDEAARLLAGLRPRWGVWGCWGNHDLPEELLLNLLGNRKPVLFVEGTADSYDTKLYSEIYKNYYVVPCGSCSRVIAQTKAMKANPQLHHLKCYGIIDRDYRSEYEIEKLELDGIYTLKVAEVENLFLVEELLNVVNTIMGFTDTLNVSKIKKYIIEKRFQPQINHQICDAVISEIKYQLSTANITGKKDDEVKQSLEATYSSIVFEDVKAAKESLFDEALHANDYAQVLKIFNYKTMSKSVGHFFGLKDEEYHDFIIRQLNSTHADEIKTAIIGYLPTEISEE